MYLFTSERTVAIVFARSAGSEAMYCADVLTFKGGFMDSLLCGSLPPQGLAKRISVTSVGRNGFRLSQIFDKNHLVLRLVVDKFIRDSAGHRDAKSTGT